MRHGSRHATVMNVARMLVSGYTAKIVGGEPLRGIPPLVIDIDGYSPPIMVPHGRKAQCGIWLDGPDGATALVATRTREYAEELLAAGEAEAALLRGGDQRAKEA